MVMTTQDTSLEQLSHQEMLDLLKRCERGTPQWHVVRCECQKRMRRLGKVMDFSAKWILACFVVLLLAVFFQ